ncbi:sugar-binding domain-containing protein [Chitinophaga nivalis]|uniref:Glycoside hydrolase family 2 n=1 Tax=Chitinophaga nivalis TaxID=2991709 RepID=A0ABT3IQH1_9BACT|nr:sugar-binding domain-containing protein [Chitinophaga nivalis]MCW3464122.1 glycoside hydrolase family 2 [Chitinophaga nivalis]MCW3486188.1 glycoside hydrolase family 2 [Chitinophaga nivalis]
MKLFHPASLIVTGLLLLSVHLQAQNGAWHPKPINIPTRWAAQVSPKNALPEYPRPQMVRQQWQNLNGLWDYAITERTADRPAAFDGQILVPYPIESALSGVQQALLPEQRLWYKRNFTAPTLKDNKRLILHFGAVDWHATVYVNGKSIGEHTGAYDSFEFDITDAIKPGNNELVVSVWDPTDTGPNMHGKQTLKPRWIRYTAVSGIWQTVWLETVPGASIASLYLTPDIRSENLSLVVEIRGEVDNNYTIKAIARNNGLVTGSIKGQAGTTTTLQLRIPNAHLWSPDDPFLYDLNIQLLYKGKMIDSVNSYFAMRKVDIKKDSAGVNRIYLNDHFTYNLGVLDQGYWPDGLYTAPTDEALRFDVATIKDMGFNTIRKHIKIEPARWYYHCDKLGMLVWQDMPSWRQPRALPEEAKQNFIKEMQRHLKQLHNFPSIISWVLFNENWGSFDQENLTLQMKKLDPTRIINGHSGPFTDQTWDNGDVTDIHLYPYPAMPPYEEDKAMVCGEFGGIFVPVPGHEWIPGKGWGHRTAPGLSYADSYRHMIEHLQLYKAEGLSGSIFTEPFDVEIEENGLMTYDRAIFKIPVDTLRRLNATLK